VHDPSWSDLTSARDSGGLLWLDVETPDDDQLTSLAEHFGLHAEMVRDSSAFGQRTRLVEYDGYVVVVTYGVAEDGVSLVELHAYVTPNAILTIRSQPIPVIAALHDRTEPVINAHTTVAALLSRILSTLAGTFTDALNTVDDELTDLEQEILDGPAPGQLSRLLVLRRRVNMFRRTVEPARDLVGAGRYIVIDALQDVSDDTRRNLRDLAIDLAHIGDVLESERDRLSSVMDVYMNEVNNRQNVIMRQLATVSTMFLPLTFLTGFFGMNFGFLVTGIRGQPAFLLLGIGLNLLAFATAMVLMWRRGWFGERNSPNPTRAR
jgi:magnesium transporter